jgi:probable HAF family extracellular repeat protein
MVGLGNLPGGFFASEALGVSADGSVVHGRSSSSSSSEAFRWTATGGMVSLKSFLIARGVGNLTGWTLREATGVSADGRTIAGTGINPSSQTEAWIATVPEPSTYVLAAGVSRTLSGYLSQSRLIIARRFPPPTR